MQVKESDDSTLPWLLPVIIVLCVVFFLVIAVLTFYVVRRKRRQEKRYIRGHDYPPLRASSHAPTHQSTIDADTFVKVTSRDESPDVPQQCPTASVVVTPLRKSPYHLDDQVDDDYDDDDGYSNSMPLEGVLGSSGTHGLSIPHNSNHPIPSPYGLGDLPPESLGQLDHYNSLPRSSVRHGVLSSDESLDSTEFAAHHRRNISSGSLPLSNQPLSTPALEVNQYWI